MIIQCEQCSTRFRLADEKLKPTGTKVRCSKCKHVFTVMPPAPGPEEEAIDFDAMNMETVSEPSQQSVPPVGGESSRDEDSREEQAPTVDATSGFTPDQAPDEEGVDFGDPAREVTGATADRGQLADDFSFADTDSKDNEETNQPAETDLRPESSFSNLLSADKAKDFSFETTPEPGVPTGPTPAAGEFSPDTDNDPAEFDFQDSQAAETTPEEFSFGEPDESVARDFEGEPASEKDSEGFDFDDSPATTATAEEFSFGKPDQVNAPALPGEPDSEPDPEAFDFEDSSAGNATAEEFSFGKPDDADDPDLPGEPDSGATSDEFGLEEHITEFSFDDDSPSDESPASEQWADDSLSADPFDFEEPAFEETSPAAAKTKVNEDSLQFGEIDFTSEAGDETPDYDIEEDFSAASLDRDESWKAETGLPSRPNDSSTQRDIDNKPLPAPAIKRKSPLSKILLLLVLLLLALSGAAAYFYMQDGSFDLTRIMQRFTGESQPAVLEQSINLKITESQYVKNIHVGQLLIVQGQAINNSPTARSAITVKGILLDANGKILFQQTVSCGNPLDQRTVKRLPFAKIEEAMNNQFGDSLSNMNVAPGSSIPFTIVFRNLPDGIANINVEVVSSKPGSG